MSLLATLSLSSIELKTTIGALPFEQQIQQTLLLDLALQLDIQQASEADNLKATLDYAILTQQLQQMAEQQHCQLIETLAAKLQKMIVSHYPQVVSGNLTLHKKGAVSKVKDIAIRIDW